MNDNENPYGPCPCGSGKKYKFCCYQQVKPSSVSGLFRGTSGGIDAESDFFADVPELAESWRLCKRGLKLMADGEYESAIELFRQAEEADPSFYTPANNLSICLWAVGRVEEAIRVQRKNLAYNDGIPNPFGLASMATFLYTSGEEEAARRFLEEALLLDMPSEDACIKVCETLARFKLHDVILAVADDSGYGQCDNMRFFTGVAAANLGDFQRAEQDLGQITLRHFKVDMARRYLRMLQDGEKPHTVMGTWPYFISLEICPLEFLVRKNECDYETFHESRIYLDFCEALLNESVANPEVAATSLGFLRHPEAATLFWTLVKGTFGPDEYRTAALQQLEILGEIKTGQFVEVYLGGERRQVQSQTVKLNSNFRFGKELSKKLQKLLEKAVKEGKKRSPDWTVVIEAYQQILREEPDHYPARYNYAVTLIKTARAEEAELILDALVAEQPEYLFARATLVQLYFFRGDIERAEALIKTAVLPSETHPAAMAVWALAQAGFYEKIGEHEMARRCAEAAYDFDPDNVNVQDLYERSKTW